MHPQGLPENYFASPLRHKHVDVFQLPASCFLSKLEVKYSLV